MNKYIIKNSGFTLVELMVVITILTILSTVGFVSYNSYMTGARDTNRISQLVSISDGLEIYRAKNDLLLPEDSVLIKANGVTIGYQGYMGKNNLELISYNKGGIDPKDGTYFSYYVSQDKKYFQLMAFLEDENNKQLVKTTENGILSIKGSKILPQTNAAVDYVSRYQSVYGKKLGILTEELTNMPIQDIPNIKTLGYLDIATTTGSYIANISDLNKVVGTGGTLISAIYNASCKRIKEVGGSQGNGIYTISPIGTGSVQAYCDMTTDGGGWTLIGRSVSGGGGGSFGYKSLTGSVFNDLVPYSLGNLNLKFSEILFGDYNSGKEWGNNIYKKYVGQISGVGSSSGATNIVSSTCSLGTITGLNYFGYANLTTNFFLSDLPNSSPSVGLISTVFATPAGCAGGNLNGLQGMIFVR